jgi:hypothetical protein
MIMWWSLATQAQGTDHHVLGNVLAEFFTVMSSASDSSREARLSKILVPNAQIVSTNYTPTGQSSVADGDLEHFIQASKEFYTTYELHYEELDRETEAYADMAVVQSAVLQRSRERASGTQFEQHLWFSLDLVYTEEGWRIAYVGWTNEQATGELRLNPQSAPFWRKP